MLVPSARTSTVLRVALLGALAASAWSLASACGDNQARDGCLSDDHCKDNRICDFATQTCVDPPELTGGSSSVSSSSVSQGGGPTTSSSSSAGPGGNGGEGGSGGEGGVGGGPFMPTDIAGCELWLRADLGVTETSGAVSGWGDQSGNGNDATQPTPASRPTLTVGDSEINGQTSIFFDVDGSLSPDFLAGVLDTSGDDYTVLVVAKITSDNDWVIALGGSASPVDGNISLSSDGATHRLRVQDSATLIDRFGSTFGGWHTLTGRNEAALHQFFQDGTALGGDETTPLVLPAFTQYRVGVRFDGVYQTGLHGKVAEVLVYDQALSDVERDQLETYFDDRYGL